jgi:2-polyprenyl-3-methyl-5-hydroxy-6-metoxy-1,4-benzoquinol methylase
MLAVARQVAQSEGLPIDFQLLSLDDGLPFEANQFDLLICALMLCHVPDLAMLFKSSLVCCKTVGTFSLPIFIRSILSMGGRRHLSVQE